VAYDDASTYLPELLTKRHLHEAATAEAINFLEALRRTVHPVPDEVYEPRRAEALSRIEVRDPDDWPIRATALALDCPIWTQRIRTSSALACRPGRPIGWRSTSTRLTVQPEVEVRLSGRGAALSA